MEDNGESGEKKPSPEHGNIYWNYFCLLAPYVISLLVLLIIFYFFPPKKKEICVYALAFFILFSVFLLLTSGKFVGFVFWLFYLPVYSGFLLLYLTLWKKEN